MSPNRIGSTRFYCFSPPVMLATFMIEIGLMVWVVYRYTPTTIVKLTSVLLLCLAIFQLAEYNVCEAAWGLDSLTWARIGFVAITALPPLGLHIILTIAQRPVRAMTLVYAGMGAFMLYFMVAAQGITSSECGGNYVIFAMQPAAAGWYGLYYYGLEIVALAASLYFATRAAFRRRGALYGMAAAYLVLLIPTTTVNVLAPETFHSIPSIMCGFAVFTALIIALIVVPRTAHQKRPGVPGV